MNTYIGSILLVAFNYAPQGWAFCQGQLMNISQNSALFSLLGTTYGGDGKATFALPNLTGAKAMTDANGNPLQWIIALEGLYPPRD
jgi:microcystin-dependent protein